MQFKMVSLYTGFNFSELEIMVLEQARNTVIGLAFCTGDQLLYDLRRVVGRLIPNLLQHGATTKVSLHLAPSNGRKFLRLSQCRHPSPPPPPASPPTGPSMSSPATRASTSPSSRVSDYTLKALHPLSSTPSFPLSPRLVNGIPQRWWLPRRSASRALRCLQEVASIAPGGDATTTAGEVRVEAARSCEDLLLGLFGEVRVPLFMQSDLGCDLAVSVPLSICA
jgi:hypothetical protein